MAKAATQQPPTGPRLNREAALLRDLSKAYLSDREFLRKRPDAKILVFLNSHEIKAYIDPDAPGSLTGFIMQLENAFGGTGRRTVVGLRHDQILNGLLFDPSRVCGILPSHGEEMDREVAFRSHHWLDTVLNLVRQAQQEIRVNRKQAERFAVVARNEKPEGLSEMQGDLVRFFQTHAPALTAILRDSLFSPHKRLQAILDESRLTLFDDIRWTDFGVGAHLAQRLKNLQPSLEQTLEVRNKLGAFDYRQNTVEANLINSAALAHMELLRGELDRGGADHLRVVLVSRARTLLRAAADMAANSRSELLVRHPRMLALTTPDADKVDEAAKLTLGTALDVWQSQLRDHQKSAQEEDGADDLAVLKQPAKAFLDAWDTFEGSRLAIEVKWRGGIQTAPQPTDDGELAKRLIAMFCSDADVETVLNQSLIERFNEFSSASSRFLLEAAQLGLRARLTKVPASGRVYIAPVAIGAVGPIQVADWPGSPDSDRALSLEEIARRVRESERPLVWSLALACAGRWKQAAIFARSALQLAELERNHDTKDEAWLLRAEIRRLGAGARPPGDPDDDQADPEERYERGMKELAKVGKANAARRLREEAAHLLEAALAKVAVPDLPGKLRHYFDALDKAADEAGGDEPKARYIALLLMLYLYDVRRSGERPALRQSDHARARGRHRDLVGLLQPLQKSGQADAMPHRARAMEVIGYVLFEAAPRDYAPPAAFTALKPANVPVELRGELPDLLKGLEAASDEIARFLRDEIDTIAEALRPFHNPELSLAPVRTPQAAIDDLRRSHPEIEAKIRRPLDTIAAVGQDLLKAGPGQTHERDIKDAIGALHEAIELGNERRIDRALMFYLRSAWLYAKLLDATLEPKFARRQRFDQLREEYIVLCDDYPKAALPHLRLSYVAEKTERHDLQQKALRIALDLVDNDEFYPKAADGPHWLQSFARRRYAMMLPGILDATLRWQGAPASGESSEEVKVLSEGCAILLKAEELDTVKEGGDEAHRIERGRRTNNIAFNGSRLSERTGSMEAFNHLSPNKPLADFIKRLAPNGIEELSDLDVLHTVGCYYAVAGAMAEAQRTAKRIYGLMSLGKQITGPNAEACYEEAFSWFKAVQPAELTAA